MVRRGRASFFEEGDEEGDEADDGCVSEKRGPLLLLLLPLLLVALVESGSFQRRETQARWVLYSLRRACREYVGRVGFPQGTRAIWCRRRKTANSSSGTVTPSASAVWGSRASRRRVSRGSPRVSTNESVVKEL